MLCDPSLLSPGSSGLTGSDWLGLEGTRPSAAAALALMRFVVIGNWAAEEPGCSFYGNVLE